MNATPEAGINWQAAANRLEVLIEALSRYYVAEGFKVDRQAGEAAMAYCRRRAAGEIGRSPRAERKMFDFLARHGIPIDWIMEGDLTSLLTRLAAAHQETKARAAA